MEIPRELGMKLRHQTLKEELQQTRPFTSVEQEAYLSILRTAAVLSHEAEQLLKANGVTQAQYNILRILRGAGAEGLCRNEVASRLVTAMPDVTRLLDRMEASGWIERRREREDRRVVSTVLTAAGRRVADKLEGPLEKLHRGQFKGLEKGSLKRIVDILAEVRGLRRD
jgi:DNA-binding MarR family transcriptional regulator